MLRIPRPQRKLSRSRGIHATTTGTVLKVRLSRHGWQQTKEAAAKLDMPIAQFMQQVVESAAQEVCDDEGTGSPPARS